LQLESIGERLLVGANEAGEILNGISEIEERRVCSGPTLMKSCPSSVLSFSMVVKVTSRRTRSQLRESSEDGIAQQVSPGKGDIFAGTISKKRREREDRGEVKGV
jgi:hypothetical protein